MAARYKILKELGKGAMGEVVLAMDTKLSRKVALKFLAAYLESDREGVDRIMREARIAADLNHPNIVHIYYFGEFKDNIKSGGYDGRTYISMEFIEGKNLRAFMNESGRLPNKTILNISMQIAEALAYAHRRNIFHRDIKPENVIISTDDQVKLLDFGLARSAFSSKLTTEQILGTPYYMSPEQADGDQNIDFRTDIFSFGILLYELITNDRPFRGDSFDVVKHAIQSKEPIPVAELNEEAARDFQKIIDKCLAKKREDRYQTTTELVKALRRSERIIESIEALTVRMADTSPKEWRESILNEARTLRQQKESEEVKKLLRTGKRRFERGNYKGAMNSFKQVIVINPDHDEANEYLERIRKALERLEIIDKYIADGEFYLSKNKYEEATEFFERALKMDPQNRTAKRGLARGEQSSAPKTGKSWPGLIPRAMVLTAALAATWLTNEYSGLVFDYFGKLRSAMPVDGAGLALANKKPVALAEDIDSGPVPEVEAQKEASLTAREQMRQNKQAALNADAANFAESLFTSALVKEEQGNDRMTSSGLDQLVAAERDFREAAALFLQATTEAQRQQALLIATRKAHDKADTDRTEMLDEKSKVPDSGKDSNESFAGGETLEAKGDTEYERGDYVSASRSYRQANARYSAAIQLAEEQAEQLKALQLSEADSARTVFVATARERGEPGWEIQPEFAETRDLASQAADAFNNGDFLQASQLYARATTGFNVIIDAREKERQDLERRQARLLTIREQDRRAIESIINDFKLSLENNNLHEYKRIVPLDSVEERSITTFFEHARRIRVELVSPSPAISGNEASVDIQAVIHYYNSLSNSNDQWTFRQRWLMKKSEGYWRVVSK